MSTNVELRRQLTNLLLERQAHMSLEDALADFPPAHINARIPHAGYTFWHLLEHLRIAQRDILDYITDPGYRYPVFPADYWPAPDSETDEAGWQQTIAAFQADRQRLVDIVHEPETDLYRRIPHAREDHHILREILIVCDHNAYHIGELAILRGVMNIW